MTDRTPDSHDPLDDRIRALLGAATADAPSASESAVRPHAPTPPSTNRGRWLAVAATVALIAAAVAALAIHHGKDNPATSPTTGPSSMTSGVPATSIPAPTTAPFDCSTAKVPSTGYDRFGTVGTIGFSSQPIDITVVPDRTTLCTLGAVSLTVTFHNRGVGTETLDHPWISLDALGYPIWGLAQLDSFSLAPGQSTTRHADLTLPAASPGQYELGILGFESSGTNITILGPSESACATNCDSTTTSTTPTITPPAAAPPVCDSLAPVVMDHVDAGSTWIEVQLTNSGSAPCRLTGIPASVTQTSGSDENFFLDINTHQPPAPLGDGIAAPGETFWLGLDVSGCTLIGPRNSWMLRWDGGTSRVEIENQCTAPIPVSALGFLKPHQSITTGLSQCTPSDFTGVASSSGGAAMGNRREYLSLTQSSTQPCVVSATPSVSVVTGTTHTPLSHSASPPGDYFGALGPAPTTLYPGDRVDIVISWGWPACQTTPPVPDAFAVSWGGATLEVHYANGQAEALCPVGASTSPLVVPPVTDGTP